MVMTIFCATIISLWYIYNFELSICRGCVSFNSLYISLIFKLNRLRWEKVPVKSFEIMHSVLS